MILSLLLLLGAGGGLAWLHVTERLEPLLAGGPSIEVELPSVAPPAQSDSAAESPSEASLDAAADGEASAVAELSSAESPPPESSTAESPAAESPPEGATVVEPPATEAPDVEAPGAEPPATESPGAESGGAFSSDTDTPPSPPPAQEQAPERAPTTAEPEAAPPPPAPPAPTIEPESDATAPTTTEPAVDAAPQPPPRGETPAADAGQADASQAEREQPPAEGTGATGPPQIAAATVPPGAAPAWREFARPFPSSENRPRVAVVVAGLGLSEAATTAAIQQLPSEITLSFSPYSNRIEEWVAMARAAGHEVMIDLPMEPASFPRDDPGPQALLTSLSDSANADRLDWILSRAEGYVGVTSYMGSRFTTSPQHLRPVLETLAQRGLLFLDSRSAADSQAAKLASEIDLAHAINDRFLDNEASRVAIDGRLQQIERIARTRGAAVAIGYAYPVTIERLIEWSHGLAGDGLTLAPISAVVERQEDR